MFDAITNWDVSVLHFIQDHVRADWLDPIMKAITHVGAGGGIFWILLSIGLSIPKKTRWFGICAFAALTLSFLINNVMLKSIVGRIRPYEFDPTIICIVGPETDTSFPSGHTAAAVSTCLGLALATWKKWPKWTAFAMVGFALLLGFTRLYVGVHYPSDVLTAVVTASLSAIAVFFICRAVERKIAEKKGITELTLSRPLPAAQPVEKAE